MASNALNPLVVQTFLDKVFYQEWNKERLPGYASVETGQIFNQLSSNKAIEKHAVFIGTGYWQQVGEEQNVPSFNSRITDQVNYTHVKFGIAEQISKEFFDDDQHDDIAKIIRSIAMNGRQTQNLKGFSVY